jgi:homoserine/homoserine lactone efflux protein
MTAYTHPDIPAESHRHHLRRDIDLGSRRHHSQEAFMIHFDLYLTFVAAVTVLMLVPGPNVALIIANSVAYGARYGLLTVAGTSSAMLLQLSVTALGMTELLGMLGSWFEWLRWIGVAYLVYLGIGHW